MRAILICRGWLVDGTGNPGRPAEAAVEGDRIVAVERLDRARVHRVIDAIGRTVSPGFIDPYSHGDMSLLANSTVGGTVVQR